MESFGLHTTELLALKSDGYNKFDNVRYHLLPWILNEEGGALMHSHRNSEDLRKIEEHPRVKSSEAESGLSSFNGGFYSYFVEPSRFFRDRKIKISVLCSDREELDKRVSELIGYGYGILRKVE